VVFSSTSHAGTIAAVKASPGITVLPRDMVPRESNVLPAHKLPSVEDTHVSLLKHSADNAAVVSFEKFVLQRMKH
jgi:DNA-binding transcriptional LysR family regulator